MVFSKPKVLKSLLLIFCFALFTATSQNRFYKRYVAVNPENFPTLERTPDGGFICCSSTYIQNHETALIKYDKCGQPEWQKSISQFSAGDMIITKDSCILLSSSNHATPKLVKLDMNGNLLWTKSYMSGGVKHYVYSVGEFPNGDLFFNGNAEMTTNAPTKSFVVKTDKNGTIKWSKYYGAFSSWGFAVACNDGGVLSRAYYLSFKTDSLGNLQWSKHFEKTGGSFEPVEVNDGFVFAKFGNTAQIDTGFLYKTDKSGNILWVSDRFKVNFLTRLKKLPNNNFLVIGSLKVDSANYRFIPSITEIDATGKFVSQRTFSPTLPGANSFHGDALCILDDNSIVITGRDRLIASSYNSTWYTAKTGKLHEFSCKDSIVTQVFPPIPISGSPHPLSPAVLSFTANQDFVSINNLIPEEIVICEGFDPIDFKLPKTLCVIPGGSLTLQAPPGYQYLWSTGDTTSSIVVYGPGPYSLQMKHPCGPTVISTGTQIHSCLTTPLAEVSGSSPPEIYPNPSKGDFTVKHFTGLLEIFRVTGEKVYERMIEKENLIKVNEFGKGLYMLRLSSENHSYNKKLLIE
jgi:hypothetical protein